MSNRSQKYKSNYTQDFVIKFESSNKKWHPISGLVTERKYVGLTSYLGLFTEIFGMYI